MLAVLALLALVALVLVYHAGEHTAQVGVYTAASSLADGLNSAREHARALVGTPVSLPNAGVAGAGSTAWVILTSNAVETLRYRVRVSDNAGGGAVAAPWPATLAVRSVLAVPRAGGWRAVLDPRVASLGALQSACAEELRLQGLEEQHARGLALTIADAFDDNAALSMAADGSAAGFEGLALAGVWQARAQVVPAAAVVRQSAFYDVDYERFWMNIMRSFTIAATEPIVAANGATNMRVRLSDAPFETDATRGWVQQWRAFDTLWRARSPRRFIPHVWRGVRAHFCLECGGSAGTLQVLDNDADYLYFSGYPEQICAPGHFISLVLCDTASEPGSTRGKRTLDDVWMVTGLTARVTYAARLDSTDDQRRSPVLQVMPGDRAHVYAGTNGWLYVTPMEDDGAGGASVAFTVPLSRERGVVALQLHPAETVAWRNDGVQTHYVAGWQWDRTLPGADADMITFSAATQVTCGRDNGHDGATLKPGDVWYWTTDNAALPADAHGVVSRIAPGQAGLAARVQAVVPLPSPYGGVAWRIALSGVIGWQQTLLGGETVTWISPRAPFATGTFAIISATTHELLVHAGPWSSAAQWSPVPGSVVRIGGLRAALQQREIVLRLPTGHIAARTSVARTALPAAMWCEPTDGGWQACAATPRSSAVDIGVDGNVQTRIKRAPAVRALHGAPTDAQAAFWRGLNERFQAYGRVLPISAARQRNAASDWYTTRIPLTRRSGTRWQIAVGAAAWPLDLWRGLELQVPQTAARLRITGSGPRYLEVDRDDARTGAARCEGLITPLATADMVVSADRRSVGEWEWRMPSDIVLPARAALLSYRAYTTNAPVRFSVAVWNAARGVWEQLCRDTPVTTRDTVALGAIARRHIATNGCVRVRVAATGGAAWLRGLYLTPGELCGTGALMRSDGQPRRSDAFTALLDAQVLRGGRLVAQQSVQALLVREWRERDGVLEPYVRCERFEPCATHAAATDEKVAAAVRL